MNVEMGLLAIAQLNSEALEDAADRFISLDQLAHSLELPEALASAIASNEYILTGDFESACRLLNVPRPLTSKAIRGLRLYAERLNQACNGRARDILGDFTETVALLSISDPFDRWDELASLIGRDWPEGLSARDAVLQLRE